MSDVVAPRTVLNLSGRIAATSAARVYSAVNLSGRIKAMSAARIPRALVIIRGRVTVTSGARVISGVIAISGRIKATSGASAITTSALLRGRITISSKAAAPSTVYLFGRVNAAVTARAIGTSPVLAPQRIVAAITTLNAGPLYVPRAFAGRIKTTSGISGHVFVMPALRGRIRTSVNTRAATNVTPRNLAGRIKSTTRARVTPGIALGGGVTAKVSASLVASLPFAGLTGRISATSAARGGADLISAVPLSASITSTVRARAVTAPAGTIFLLGNISARTGASAATDLTAWLVGVCTATSVALRNSPIQPLIPLLLSKISIAVQANLLTSELLEPLPPYPLPFPTLPIEYYLDLITSEHNQKPKYLETVRNSIDAFVENEFLVASIPGLFDLDYSIGQQEDFTGQWIGKSRWIELPNVFFSWDIEGLGWNQANWRGPYDSSDKLQRLDDYHYRLLLYAAVIANHWDGSIPKAYEAWDILFHYTGLKVVIQDYGNMSMMYGMLWDQAPDMVLLSLFTSGYMDLKPEGIVLLDYVFQSEPSVPFFGFDGQSDAVSGWDSGYWGILVPPGQGYVPLTSRSGEQDE